MRRIFVGFCLVMLVSVTALAQPTLEIRTETPGLPSELWYGNVKVKPVRLRPGTNIPITIDDLDFLVFTHYPDFLRRMPDQAGFASWMSYLNGCNGDLNCLYGPNGRRTITSGGFFGSPEFAGKGRYTVGFYRVAFNRSFNVPEYTEFIADMAAVTGATQAETNAKRAAYANNFVLRAEFVNIYGSMSNSTYVNTLMGRYGLSAITAPDPANPESGNLVNLTTQNLIDGLNGGTLTRAQVLRAMVESPQVSNVEANPIWVATQYYGYLKRTPEPAGFNAWLSYLNSHPGDYNTMVWGFLDSPEYRNRF